MDKLLVDVKQMNCAQCRYFCAANRMRYIDAAGEFKSVKIIELLWFRAAESMF